MVEACSCNLAVLKATALRSSPLSRNPPLVKSQILATRREKRENRAHTRQSESEPQTSVLLTFAKSCDIFAAVSRVAAISAVQQPSHRPRCQPRKREGYGHKGKTPPECSRTRLRYRRFVSLYYSPSVIVEPRYLNPIAGGIRRDGMEAQ